MSWKEISVLLIVAIGCIHAENNLIQCEQICSKEIDNCIDVQNSDCGEVYQNCQKSQDTMTCLSKVNGIFINKIYQCYHQICLPTISSFHQPHSDQTSKQKQQILERKKKYMQQEVQIDSKHV